MSIYSELSDSTDSKEIIDTGQNSEVDRTVVLTEILHYQDEPG